MEAQTSPSLGLIASSARSIEGDLPAHPSDEANPGMESTSAGVPFRDDAEEPSQDLSFDDQFWQTLGSSLEPALFS